MGDAQVALVNMPFSFSKYPSIQLGTLSALLKSQGIAVDCHHLNVRFAHKIGVPLYELICEKRALFGEWLFSYLLFRDNPKRAEYPESSSPSSNKSPSRADSRLATSRKWPRKSRRSF